MVQATGITTTLPWMPILTDKSLALSPTRWTHATLEQWRECQLHTIHHSNLDMVIVMAIMATILP